MQGSLNDGAATKIRRVGVTGRASEFARRHPVWSLLARRTLLGLITLFVVSVIVFAATTVLPGNAAYSVLGHTATPERIHELESQLHLNGSLIARYWHWLSGLLGGNPGTSLVNQQSVTSLVGPELRNTAVLVLLAGVISTVVGIALGAVAALRKDRAFDHASSVLALAVTALPEFVVGIGLVIVFSTLVFHLLPAVSVLPPGTPGWEKPNLLVLPVATLVIVVVPYLFRMTRAVLIEALESDYVEMARLKGVPQWRVVLFHALPNAIPPMAQVIGLDFLYLAGGIVVVEYVFNYNGIGQGLVNAVSNRDIPVIQFIVLVLAAFYVFVNIVTDVVALLATPRRRLAR
jgi:peptide/nickel transport system permease protein